MFTADLAWAGPLLGIAALAIRTYLKGRTAMSEKEVHPSLQRLRNAIWDDREAYLDALLLHECDIKQACHDLVWVVGWDVEKYIDAALRNRRDLLDG